MWVFIFGIPFLQALGSAPNGVLRAPQSPHTIPKGNGKV
ncbi:hypothetical protein TSC_c08300 [Thermus scotoductus SA-01]|uniref:Uncharacterized protein n=1 Tax=Thermus scotoductus (strain ATCC 700910 / SA-01) TaxID=743525 RepID=E8PNI0_THESS|nr:hypothetical protein TSC_c08300 [Thermus scotoductus SA-01]